MTIDVPISARIQQFREKAVAGTLTPEEMREAVALLRQGRSAAASQPKKATSTKTKAKGPVDTQGLLDELDNL